MAYYNIRVNGVAPGLTIKNFEQVSGQDVSKKGTEKTMFFSEKQIPFEMHPLVREELDTDAERKIIEAKDVADVAVWL